MAKRFGTVLVFKPGVTKAAADAALAKLADVLAPDYHGSMKNGKFVTTAVPPVHEFNDEHGGPVWYIP